MDAPFDSDLMDEAYMGDLADASDVGDAADSPSPFDEGAGDDFSEMSLDTGDDGFEGDTADDLGDGFDTEGADDTALWDAFEEEVADGLDAAELLC